MALPFCHSRRPLSPHEKAFFCAHPMVHAKGSVVSENVCRMCRRWQEPPPTVFRNFAPPAAEALPRTSCVFFGELVGMRACRGCRGLVKLKVFRCGHPAHRETTLRECETCPDFTIEATTI